MLTAPTQTPSSAKADSLLGKEQMTALIISSKVNKNLTWTAIAEQIGVDEVWQASACLGMNSMKPDVADKLCAVLELPEEVKPRCKCFPL